MAQLAAVDGRTAELQTVQTRLNAVIGAKRAARVRVDDIANVIARRTEWIRLLEAVHGCLLDGMWLTALDPVVTTNGTAVTVTVSGRGFEDKLSQYDTQAATPIEQFRDRLLQPPFWAEGGTASFLLGTDAILYYWAEFTAKNAAYYGR